MLISITSSGGQLGTGLPSAAASATAPKVIDTNALAEPAKREALRYFDPKGLAALSTARSSRSADRPVYHVTVSDAQGKRHSFDVSESEMPAEMLDLIDSF